MRSFVASQQIVQTKTAFERLPSFSLPQNPLKYRVTSQGRAILHNLLYAFKGVMTILSALVAKPPIRICLAAAVGIAF
jgi:hypothetical protein